MNKTISHCIFDVDGTLLDTESLYEQAFREIIEEHGGSYTTELRDLVAGTPMTNGIKTILNTLHLQMTEVEYLAQMIERLAPKLPNVKLMPGAERLVRHLHDHDIPMAVATSSDRRSLEVKTAKHAELFKLFKHIVTTPDDPEVKLGKPNPDVFLVAAARFADKPPAERILVFEDSTAGVTAALNAQMIVVMIPDPRLRSTLKVKPTAILNSLEDFNPQDFGLPPYKNVTP